MRSYDAVYDQRDNVYDRKFRPAPKKKLVVAKAMPPPPGSAKGNLSGYRGSANKAWLQDALHEMAKTGAVAMSLTPYCEIAVQNASATFHGYASPDELITSCLAAVQGEARKDTRSSNLNANAANVTDGTAAAGIPVFGWRLRLTGSALNFAYRPFIIDVGPILDTAGAFSVPTPVITFAAIARRLPVDILILSPANAGGLMTIVPGTQADVIATTTTTSRSGVVVRTLSDTTQFAVFETLNARDLISRPTERRTSLVPQDNDIYGERDDGGMEFYPGIRDQDIFGN